MCCKVTPSIRASGRAALTREIMLSKATRTAAWLSRLSTTPPTSDLWLIDSEAIFIATGYSILSAIATASVLFFASRLSAERMPAAAINSAASAWVAKVPGEAFARLFSTRAVLTPGDFSMGCCNIFNDSARCHRAPSAFTARSEKRKSTTSLALRNARLSWIRLSPIGTTTTGFSAV